MGIKPNYFKLGVFILIALFLLMSGIILFGSGALGQKKIYFETFFKDSVSGLTTGASVQDNGVEIGRVEKISFIRTDYTLPESQEVYLRYRPYVRVVCSVTGQNMPELTHEENQKRLNVLIKNGLRLRLSTNILTGQGIVEADYVEPERFPVEIFPWKPEYPYIPSAPSTFTTLKDSVDRILRRLDKIETEKIATDLNTLLISVNQAVNDLEIAKVRSSFEELMNNTNQAIADANIAELSDEIKGLFTEARKTNQDLKTLLENPDPRQDLSNVAELVDRLNTTVNQIDRLVQTQSPRILEILENFKQISDNLNRLTKRLEQNPSDLLLSQPPDNKEDL
jgi:paraquat-inducible protein B